MNLNFPSLLWMLYLWRSRALLKRLTVFDPWSLERFPNSNWSYTNCTGYTQQNRGTGVMKLGPCLESHLSKGPFTTSSASKSCSFPNSTNLWRKNPDNIKFQSPKKTYLLSASKCRAKCRKYVPCSFHIEGPALRQCHDESDLKTELHWRAEIRPVGDPLSWMHLWLPCWSTRGYSKWMVSFLQVMCRCPSLEGVDYAGWRGRERGRVEMGEREILQDGEECWVQTWKAFSQLWYCTIPEANIKLDDGSNKPILSGERSFPGWT